MSEPRRDRRRVAAAGRRPGAAPPRAGSDGDPHRLGTRGCSSTRTTTACGPRSAIYAGTRRQRVLPPRSRCARAAGRLRRQDHRRAATCSCWATTSIHAVTNPERRLTGAIHVYGGDFVNQPRSQWGPGPREERPYDMKHCYGSSSPTRTAAWAELSRAITRRALCSSSACSAALLVSSSARSYAARASSRRPSRPSRSARVEWKR